MEKREDFEDSGLPWNQGSKSSASRFGMGYNAYASKKRFTGWKQHGIRLWKQQKCRNEWLWKRHAEPGTKEETGLWQDVTVQKAASLDYKEGDRVKHAKFGEGTVKEIIDGSRDYEVTVEFDKGGQKKMLAGFAKLERI